jgi:hypothetical protein
VRWQMGRPASASGPAGEARSERKWRKSSFEEALPALQNLNGRPAISRSPPPRPTGYAAHRRHNTVRATEPNGGSGDGCRSRTRKTKGRDVLRRRDGGDA